MGSLCSPSTNTTVQSNTPPPQVLANYQALVDRANSVASQPYTNYGGQIYAGMDPMTSQGIGNLYGVGAAATPYINAGYQAAGASAGPIAGQIAGFAQGNMNPYAADAYRKGPQFQTFEQGLAAYQNPYTQDVINATMAQMHHQDAVAQNGALGTAIKAGNAFGGDRMGVAAAELARGQGANRASTLAGLQNQGFQQAVGQYNQNQAQALAGAGLAANAYGQSQQLGLNALQGDQAAQARAASLYGNLGQMSQNSALAGAQALIQGGQMYQQDAQNRLNVPYQQWQQQQAFPYQQTNWLGNLVMGTGSASGGTGTTQSPGASPLSQGVGMGATLIGGLGMAGLLKRGGPVGFAGGGAIGPYQQPIDFTSNSMNLIIPETGPMPMGAGPPRAPQAAAAPDPAKEAAGALGSLKGAFGSAGSNALPFGASVPDAMGATSVGGPQGFAPLNYSGNLGPLYAGGGFVPGYAEGGDVINPDDPWRMPDQQAIDDWRASNDFLMGHRDAPAIGEVLPPLPRAAVPMPMGRPAGADVVPATALAYDRPPPPPPTNFGLAGAGPVPVAPPPPQGGEPTPVSKPDPWQALMQAGLAMMASRNPSALGAIGEGGLAGLSNYGQQKAAYDKLDANPIIDNSGPTTRIYFPSTKTWIDTGKPTISAAQAASNERMKEQHSESIAARREAQGETAAYRRDMIEQRRLEAEAAERRHKEGRIPEGWERTPEGVLRIIPGGPADPEYIAKISASKVKPREFSVNDITKLSEEGGKFADLATFGTTFKPEYAGKTITGDAANWAGRNLPEGVVGKDVAEGATWWQGYDRFKNVVRNELFGAALTATEKAAFEQADVNARMEPDQIKKNLATQKRVVENGLKRKANAMLTAGFKPESIAAAYGLKLEDIGVSADGKSPPAGGGGAPKKGDRKQFNLNGRTVWGVFDGTKWGPE